MRRSNGRTTARRRPARNSSGWRFWGPTRRRWASESNVPLVTQSQVAATLAALLGEDYCAAVPQAAKPIADVLGSRTG